MERFSRKKGLVRMIALSLFTAFLLMFPVLTTGGEGGETEGDMMSRQEEVEEEVFPIGELLLEKADMEQYFYGEDEEEFFGYRIEEADLNADGNGDIIITAPGYNESRGAVFIFFGGDTGRLFKSGDADTIIEQSEDLGFFGLDIDVGDVDKDGSIDLLVSGFQDSNFGPEEQTEPFKVYLFLGKDGWAPEMTTDDADVVYQGTSKKHALGWDIEVGDVTGDGYDDVVISEMEKWQAAPDESGGGGGGGGKQYEFFQQLDRSGKDCQVYSGSPDRNQGTYTYLMTNYGRTTYGFCEFDLSEIKPGIVVDEAIISFYHRYNTNYANLELLRVDGEWGEMTLTWNNRPPTPDRVALMRLCPQNSWQNFQSEEINELIADWVNGKTPNYGVRIGGENGVFNNCYIYSSDGTSVYEPKIWFKYHKSGASGLNGSVYIFDGGPNPAPERNITNGISPTGYDHVITNSLNSTGLAKSDLDLGDINGDGFMDILIGSSGVESDGFGSGEVEVVFGGANMPGYVDLQIHPHVRIKSNPGFQLSQVTHADMNGDGCDEVITSAPFCFYDQSGGIFIFNGSTTFPTGDLSILHDRDVMIRGPYPECGLGVTGTKDFNHDGRDDLFLHLAAGVEDDNRGCYYLYYSNRTDTLTDGNLFMSLESPPFVIHAYRVKTGFADPLYENIAACDRNGDGLLEIVMGDPFGFYQVQPEASGIMFTHYQTPYDIALERFELLDGDGADGTILGAEKTYHFQGHAINMWHIDDLLSFDLIFYLHGDLEGQSIELGWEKGFGGLLEERDPYDYVEIVSSSVVILDDHSMDIYLNVTFARTMISEEFMDMFFHFFGGKEEIYSSSFPSMFKVEPDVELVGDLLMVGDINGDIVEGTYVQPNERMELSGFHVVYEDTTVRPPDDFYSVQLNDDKGNVLQESGTDGAFVFVFRTSQISGREELNLSLVDLLYESDDESDEYSFFYHIDADAPSRPLGLIVRADSESDLLMGYDDDPDVYVQWDPCEDATSNVIGYLYATHDGSGTGAGTFVQRNMVLYEGLSEGWNTIYVWAVDEALNYGEAASVSVYYDVDPPIFFAPSPAPGSWVNTKTVTYEITIGDGGGSGVKGRSVEYAVSIDGGRTYSAWEPTNLRRDGNQLNVKLILNFREGDGNYVKWRARDIAGNGFVESDAFGLNVDTIPLTYRDPSPSEPSGSSYVSLGVTLSDGKGSGIDARTIQYSISHNGVSSYTPWEQLELVGVHDSITVETPPIYFEKDTINYIRWRALDVAGNGWTYSADIPIEVLPERRNHEPVPIISSPEPYYKYLESSGILFDGSLSVDADDADVLSYLWYSDKDGYLGTDSEFRCMLSQNNHMVTLHVSDGKANVSISVEIIVVPDITRLDTDRDGVPDIIDDDDDGDGLLDIEEDLNRNGLLDGNETDSKSADTDGDGISDRYDPSPRDPAVTDRDVSDRLPLWLFVAIVVLILLLIVFVGLIFVIKQRTDRARGVARRELRRTKRNLKRFEVLTGVPTHDLPAIEAVQWSLPGVISEASEFVLESAPSDDLLPPRPDDDLDVGVGSEPPVSPLEKPDLSDLEVPTPSSDVVGAVGGMESAAVDPGSGSGVVDGSGGRVHSCSLCGSEVLIPEGQSSGECPLCGEIITV